MKIQVADEVLYFKEGQIKRINYKSLWSEQESRFSELLNHYSNLSKTNHSMSVMISEIDRCQEELYYGIVKDDISDIIKEDISAEDKIEEIQKYLDSLL